MQLTRPTRIAPALIALVITALLPAGPATATPGESQGSSAVAASDSTAPRTQPRTIRISQTMDGTAAPGSSRPAISGDGRYVAFDSYSPLLAPPRTATIEVYVTEVATGKTVKVSVASDGTSGNESSFYAAISRTGRFVAYKSHATNLVSGDTNNNGDFFVHDRDSDADGIFDEPGAISTERVSVASDGTQVGAGNEHRVMGRPSMSPDGRFLVFASRSDVLVPGDSNGVSDVFVRDRLTDTTERVSLSAEGAEGDSHSFGAGGDACPSCDSDDGANGSAISADGRYVTFTSTATNLVAGDTNGLHDIFVRDRQEGTTTRVSVATDGTQMAGRRDLVVAKLSSGSGGMDGMISADGRYVTFESNSQGLVPVDQLHENKTLDLDIFVHDRDADGDGTYDEPGGISTRRVNVSSAGAETNNPDSRRAVISPDGRHIAFFSLASNLVDGDTNRCGSSSATKCWDVFIHDIALGWTERVSVAHDGAEGNELSLWPSISDDARYVTFMSFAKNLLEEEEPLRITAHVFVRDRGPEAGVGNAALRLTEDEKTLRVAGWTSFHGARLVAAQDVAGDTDQLAREQGGDLIGASVAYRPALEDLLIQMDVHELPVDSSYVVPLGGSGGTIYGFELGSNGRTYEVRVSAPQHQTTTGIPRTTNHWSEREVGGVVSRLPSFELYDCTSTCASVASLAGSYGTTGNAVWAALPLELIGAQEGDALAGLRASTATGGAVPHDEITLADVTIPARRLEVGTAPAGAAEAHVDFTDVSEVLDETGRFDLTLDTSALGSGAHRLWARGCLGDVCEGVARPFSLGSIVPSTTLSFTGASDVTGQYSDTATFEAELLDDQGRALANAVVVFELVGGGTSDTVTAATGPDGRAVASLLLTAPPGAYQLYVRYDGADGLGRPSEAVTDFLIAKEDTALELSLDGRGVGQELIARLADLDTHSDGLGRRTITFLADGEEIGSSTTDDDGIARLQVPPRYRSGRSTFEAIFAGDQFYVTSSAETTPKGAETPTRAFRS